MSASDTASPSRPIRSHTMSSPDINQFPAFSSVPDGRGRVRHQTLGVHDLKKWVLDMRGTKDPSWEADLRFAGCSTRAGRRSCLPTYQSTRRRSSGCRAR